MSDAADFPAFAAGQAPAAADELARLQEHARRVFTAVAAPDDQRQLLLFTCGAIQCAAPLAELRGGPTIAPPIVPLPFSPPWLLGVFLHLSASEILGLADPLPMLTGDPTATGGPWLAPEPAPQKRAWPFPTTASFASIAQDQPDFAGMGAGSYRGIAYGPTLDTPASVSVAAPAPRPLRIMIVGSGERSLAFAIAAINDMATPQERELLPLDALSRDMPLPFRRKYLAAVYTPSGADSCYVLNVVRLLDDMLGALELAETGALTGDGLTLSASVAGMGDEEVPHG